MFSKYQASFQAICLPDLFDELTLQDWEVGTPGTYEVPFTFSGAEYLDKIEG